MENESTEIKTYETKFCKHCGRKIAKDAVICVLCGRQVEEFKIEFRQQPNIVINNSNVNNDKAESRQQPIVINNSNINSNTNTNVNVMGNGKPKNKWVALALLLLLGTVGGHKFYEGKIGMGIVYFFTCGLLGIGIIVDLISILTKPNPYYV